MFEGHPSWRSIIAFYVKGLLLVLIAAFAVAIGTGIGDDAPTPAWSPWSP